ncbi:MAG: hypothetical protein IPG89_20755 [Bacteroidetes bacterium]|nr:hypothetical protein [Bacteroidota bacterium]
MADVSSVNPTIDTTTAGDIIINYAPRYDQLTNFNQNLYEAWGNQQTLRLTLT